MLCCLTPTNFVSPLLFSGITRLPIIEGEISHIEIPRTATNLGMTIVGGADTPLVSSASVMCRGWSCLTVLTVHVGMGTVSVGFHAHGDWGRSVTMSV